MVKDEKKRKYRQRPTQKQLVALQLIANGETARQAMLKAGYSKGTAEQPGNKLYKSNAAIDIMSKVRVQLNHQGVTTAYIIEKYKRLLDDNTLEARTQLEAMRDVMKLWGVGSNIDKKTPSRVITLEEYLDDDIKVSSKDNSSEVISSEV